MSADLVAAFCAEHPAAGALAEAVSIAARIEPQLLRRMRLTLGARGILPDADASAEADLWLGPLVETRTPAAIVLDAGAAAELQRRLAERPAVLHAAWLVIREMHRDVSPAVLVEEKLTYLALAGKERRMRALLRSAVATLVAPGREGLAAWASRALTRLPEGVRAAEEARMLASGTSLRVGGPAAVPNAEAAAWRDWLAPPAVPTVEVGVGLLERGVELGPADGPNGHRITVPRMDPVEVEVAWEAATWRRLRHLEGHAHRVTSCAWSPDGRLLATGSRDDSARVWDARDGALLYALGDHGGAVNACAWSPDGRRLATASADGRVRLWDAESGEPLDGPEAQPHAVTGCAWSRDGRLLATIADDERVLLWSTADWALARTLHGAGVTTSCAWSPDARRLATTAADGTVRLWDSATGRATHTLAGSTDGEGAAAWSPDGRWLATGGRDGKARLWNASDGALVHVLEEHARYVSACAWSPDSEHLVTASDGTVRVWEAAGARVVHAIHLQVPVPVCAWSPDGRALATATQDDAWLWDAERQRRSARASLSAGATRVVHTPGRLGAVELDTPLGERHRLTVPEPLTRVRPARVHITYDTETGGAIEARELPWVMGVLADLGGDSAEPAVMLRDRKFAEVTRENFDEVMRAYGPRVAFDVPNALGGVVDAPPGVELRFERLADFEPDAVVARVPPLSELLALRTRLSTLRAALRTDDRLDRALAAAVSGGARAATIAEADRVIERTGLSTWRGDVEALREPLRAFFLEMASGAMTGAGHIESALNVRVAEIDEALSSRLSAILHHPAFERVEATWRGLHFLVSRSDTGPMLRIKVLNVTKAELLRDQRHAAEFDQSVLWKKVYEDEYGVFGGTPFGALVGDYYFDQSAEDVELLGWIAKVAAEAHAPFLTATAPSMFYLESFAQLDQPRDLARYFDLAEYARWKAFRAADTARYVVLTLPRMLLRAPYGGDAASVEAFAYDERVGDGARDAAVWGNAAYALAANVNRAFALHGWTARIQGVASGGLVEGLPAATRRAAGEIPRIPPTEAAITARRDWELSDLGFAPLVHDGSTPTVAFNRVQSAHQAKPVDSPDAAAEARYSTGLPNVLAASRFAHYLKVIMRDRIGSYISRQEIETYLNRWIVQYVGIVPDAPPAIRAKRPLAEARVDVQEVAGRPGAYRAVVQLRPHFQFDDLSTAMRLVVDLPSGAA